MSCADQEEGERGGFPWKFLEEGDLKPQPPTLWKILTSQIYIPVAKLQKTINELCELENFMVGIYNSGSIGEPESQYLFILVFGFSVKYLVYSFIGLASAFI